VAAHTSNDVTVAEPVALTRAVLKQVAKGRREKTLPFPRHARVQVMPTTAGADLIVTHITRDWAQAEGGGWSAEATALAGKLAEIARQYDGVSVLADLGDGRPRPFAPSST
jgi:hypothetical protein